MSALWLWRKVNCVGLGYGLWLMVWAEVEGYGLGLSLGLWRGPRLRVIVWASA